MSKISTRYSILILAVVLLFSTMICTGITGQTNAAPPRSTAIVLNDSQISVLSHSHTMIGSGLPEREQSVSVLSSGADRETQLVPIADVTVYITRTGAKYHRAGCRYLARSCIPVKLSDAKKMGYTPCSVCGPPE